MEVLWEGGSGGRPPGRGDVLGCEQAEFCVGPGLRSLAQPSLRWVQEGGTADGVVCLGVTGSRGWHGADAGQRVGKSAPAARRPCTGSFLPQPCLCLCSSLWGFFGRTGGASSPLAARGPRSGRGGDGKASWGRAAEQTDPYPMVILQLL